MQPLPSPCRMFGRHSTCVEAAEKLASWQHPVRWDQQMSLIKAIMPFPGPSSVRLKWTCE